MGWIELLKKLFFNEGHRVTAVSREPGSEHQPVQGR